MKDVYLMTHWQFLRHALAETPTITVHYRDKRESKWSLMHTVADNRETMSEWCRVHFFPLTVVDELYGP